VSRIRDLLSLTSSYVLRRPANTIAGAARTPLAIAALPAAAVWAAVLATTGALTALRIGVRVRRAPVLRASREVLATPDELVPVCSLVSDTHVVAPRRSPFELEHDRTQWPWGDLPSSRAIAIGLRRVLAHIFRHAPRTVIWCGDEVDTGDELEWRLWRDIVDTVPGLAHRVLPGNHDVCFNRPYDEDYTLARRALRERAYQAHAGRLADFPIVDTIITEAGPATVVLLDSCRHRSTHVLSNAVGHFADDQLAELERVLAATRGPVLVATHHHVWRDERFLQPDAWYETALDADQLVAILGAYRARDARNHVLVCHGHRHIFATGSVGDRISIVGLPSTTLGDKARGTLDGVLRYAIAGLRRDGTWGVAIREVGVLAEPETVHARLAI
jgi:hypothetical protein